MTKAQKAIKDLEAKLEALKAGKEYRVTVFYGDGEHLVSYEENWLLALNTLTGWRDDEVGNDFYEYHNEYLEQYTGGSLLLETYRLLEDDLLDTPMVGRVEIEFIGEGAGDFPGQKEEENMTKDTGSNCEGTQVFLTEILTTGAGRVSTLGTSLNEVVADSFALVRDEVGFPDRDHRILTADAVNAGDTDLARDLLGEVTSESEEVAWGDIAVCYQVHVGCDCSPEQRKVEPSDLPGGCPECEIIGSWSLITDEVWYCEACGHQSGDADGEEMPVSTDLV